MPETSTSPATPAQLTAGPAALIHGPYADTSTTAVAELAAEAIRYLNYAARGGISEPATIAAVAGSLTLAAGRLPQLLHAISQWLAAELAAGRVADDHHRAPAQLTDRIRAAISRAADTADELASALSTVHNLTATLHGTEGARGAHFSPGP
jgi:hypothetical protein